MFYFPPRLQLYTEKGEPHLTLTGNAREEGLAAAKWQLRLSKAGPLLLVFAFLLQLVATSLAR